MADKVRVRAVLGALVPTGRPGEFVGYRQATSADPESAIVHRMGNGGPAYVLNGTVEVLNVTEVRRAIAKGSLSLAVDEAPVTTSLRPIAAAPEE